MERICSKNAVKVDQPESGNIFYMRFFSSSIGVKNSQPEAKCKKPDAF
jgi:hypothetical protein